MRSRIAMCIVFLVTMLCVLTGMFLVGGAHASNFVYREDFSSMARCDTANTSAVWDTVNGTLRLARHELSLAGSYTSGYTKTLAVEGDNAFIISTVNARYYLYALDISDPQNPLLRGSVEIPCWYPVVAVRGDIAYAAGNNGCFFSIDISDPSNPAIIAESDITGAYPYAIRFHGDCAFVSSDGVVSSVDISDPGNPVEMDYLEIMNSLGITVHGDYMFVSCGFRGLRTLDISDPADMSVVDTCLACTGYMAAVSGDRAYLPYGTVLNVADVSDPADVSSISSAAVALDARFASISGDYAVLSDWDGDGLILVDISDPSSPVRVENLPISGNVMESVVAGEFLYAVTGTGFIAAELSERADLVEVDRLTTGGSANRVIVSGDYAFVPSLSGGVKIVDISDPVHPSVTGACLINGAAGMEISGDLAFVAAGASGMSVWDISAPAYWSLVNAGFGTQVVNLDIDGDLAFTVGGNGGRLEIIDVSRPGSMSIVGSYNGLTGPYDVFVHGDLAYIADPYGTDLTIVDISDPSSPSYVGSHEWGQFVRTVTVSGDHAFLAGDTAGLLVADVSDPSNPVPAGQYNTSDRAMYVAVDGDYAYVADEYSGLLVLDISDPTDPVYVDHIDTPGLAAGVARFGDYLLLADQDEGMFTFRGFITGTDKAGCSACSRVVDETDETINLVSVSVARTGTVSIDISADGGSNWEAVPLRYIPDPGQAVGYSPAAWYELAYPGQDLLWRAALEPSDGTDPSIAYLRIDYSSETATLLQDYSVNVEGPDVAIEWALSQIDGDIRFGVSRIEEGSETVLDPAGIERSGLNFRFLDRGLEPGTSCRYIVRYDNCAHEHTLFETGAVRIPEIPLTLYQNSPNPFNPSTVINYYLPERAVVNIEIFDAAGRLARRLFDGPVEKGSSSAVWDGTLDDGRKAASGVYFCRLRAGKESLTRKMVLMR